MKGERLTLEALYIGQQEEGNCVGVPSPALSDREITFLPSLVQGARLAKGEVYFGPYTVHPNWGSPKQHRGKGSCACSGFLNLDAISIIGPVKHRNIREPGMKNFRVYFYL